MPKTTKKPPQKDTRNKISNFVVSDKVYEYLKNESEKSGNTITSIVRSILNNHIEKIGNK